MAIRGMVAPEAESSTDRPNAAAGEPYPRVGGQEAECAPRVAASAQGFTGAPPEVDRLSVRVVADSYYHKFEAAGRFGAVEVQRFGRRPVVAVGPGGAEPDGLVGALVEEGEDLRLFLPPREHGSV